MRVSSGVRNLIAWRGGGDGGEDGSAGGAPGASPPPVPAQTGAAAESATGTLAAGRRAVEALATTLDAADGHTGARRVSLEELVSSVDARAAEGMGESDTVVRAENLPELTRSAGAAEQLGALQETLRIDAAASGSETAGGFRASEVEGAVSMHPATGGGGPLEIEPSSAVYGNHAAIARPHSGVPWGQGPEMKLGLLGGADHPPQPAAPESDFLATNRRLRDLQRHYNKRSRPDIANDFKRVITRVSRRVLRQFGRFGGNQEELAHRPIDITTAEQAYRSLQETARQAEPDGDLLRAGAIRDALDAIDKHAVEALQALCTEHGIAEAPSTQAMQPPPAAAALNVTVTAIPPPARTPMQFDWITAYRQLRDLGRRFPRAGWDLAHVDFNDAAIRISGSVTRKFRRFGGNPNHLLPTSSDSTKPEQAYLALENMFRRAERSNNVTRAYEIRQALEDINKSTTLALDDLTRTYDALLAPPTQAMQRPPVTVGSMTVPPPGRLDIAGQESYIVLAVDPAFPESAGGLVHTTDVPDPPPASSLPGPSLSDAGDLGRGKLDPLATASGTTTAQPAATRTIVAPPLAEASSFWLKPVDPMLAPDSVPFDPGLRHAGAAVQPPPVTTAGRSGAGAGPPLPAADPWGIRPPGMGGEPHPVAFEPWLAPPGPSSQVAYTETMRTPVMSVGAPPGWQGAETPGFARAASGAVELPFSQREAIARQLGTEDALLQADLALHTGGAGALGWSATRSRAVLADLDRLHDAIVQSDSATAAAMVDVDWRAIEALVRILDIPPPSP